MHSRSGRWSVLTLIFATVTACTDAAGPSIAPNDEVLGAVEQNPHERWLAQATPIVLDLPGTVFADHDEANNRLVFGVQHGASRVGIQRAMLALGVPAAEFVIVEAEPIFQVATLRERWRPTQGGIQIHFGGFLCTMGFNVDHSGGRSFITNSHCTDRQGGVEGTQYFQPTSTVDPTVIATEVADPTYFRGGICPKGKKCRWSDASRALYSGSVASTRGAIAKTSGPNNGSLTVTGSFSVTSQDNSTTNFGSGTTVNKVGRTTGWTQGNVTQSCVHTGVSGSNIVQLCQTFVQNPGGATLVGGGDSGSGVFRITSGDNVQLVGILWGGSGDGKLFVFSPLSQIQNEIGSVNAVR